MSITKILITIIIIFIIGGISYLLFDMWQAGSLDTEITNFEECIAGGYPMTDDEIPSCETPDGRIFVKEINDSQITSFAECLAAGYPIMESYPRQCRTASGQHFTEDIGNELDQTNLIRVSSPRPGETVTSPLKISGQARGNWFFEATFPIAIYDANGRELGRHYAEAQTDWMTEEFVSFTADLEFNQPTTGTGNLILEKANPSGLPENEDQLTIPITFDTLPPPNSNDNRVSGGCIITGCSSHVCSDQEVITTCEYLEEYACYQTAQCGRDSSGQCNWISTEALTQCLAGAQN